MLVGKGLGLLVENTTQLTAIETRLTAIERVVTTAVLLFVLENKGRSYVEELFSQCCPFCFRVLFFFYPPYFAGILIFPKNVKFDS